MWGMTCGRCDKSRSNWQLTEPTFDESGEITGTEDPVPICSLCFLYESGWGERNTNEIEEFIAEVEQKDGYKMLRAKNGQLLQSKDSDKILGAVCLISKMREISILKQMRAQERAREETEEGKK